MLSSTIGPQQEPLCSPCNPSSQGQQPATVIGLYGLPGSGKTILLHEMAQQLGRTDFSFHEGSQLIDAIVPGGLRTFEAMQEMDKVYWRGRAIRSLGTGDHYGRKVAVVTGHFMFWSEERDVGQPVYTSEDLDTFTHILYLDVPAEDLFRRRQTDTKRSRPALSADHLRKWQEAEKVQLRELCLQHSIIFSTMPSSPHLQRTVSSLLQDFRDHSEDANRSRTECRLDAAIDPCSGELETVLVIDADKTLSAEDTGTLFWQVAARNWPERDLEHRLKTLFSSTLGYSHTAFRQAAMYYDELASEGNFDSICQKVVAAVSMHPEFVSLLQVVAEQQHVRAVVVTCGLQCIWEEVLKREGVSERIKVIGSGLITGGLIITPSLKRALVARLQVVHRVSVWAFGDSPLDLEMLIAADRAVVVVGEDHRRSRSMDARLGDAIESDGLRAWQVTLPYHASARLDTSKLPILKLTDQAFLGSVLRDRRTDSGLRVLCATAKNTAKLLATPMRDAENAGPALREAHRRAGWYLGVEFVAEVIGLEQRTISHVLNRQTKGYQLQHERQTTIVALMRGGDPMAAGVNDAFPRAMYVHAKEPHDISLHHVSGQVTLILVDSVVNTGKTIVEFVQHIRHLHATIQIVIVAGVVQVECIQEDGLRQKLADHSNIHFITLRHSDTKFVGSGSTDTGNRLFNTTHLL